MQYARVIGLVVVPLIAAAVHIAVAGVRKRHDAREILLRYVLGISIGVNGIFAFVGHFFFSDMVAASIGWPAGNPFQLEVAFTNLALGALGVLSIWYRGGFRVATAVAATTFLFGANIVHLMDLVAPRALDGTSPSRPSADGDGRASARAAAAAGSCVVAAGLVAAFVSGDWALWIGTSVPIGLAVGAGLHIARLRAPST